MAGRRAGILVDGVQRAIVVIRGQRLMLDADLAALYGVPTKALVQYGWSVKEALLSLYADSSRCFGSGSPKLPNMRSAFTYGRFQCARTQCHPQPHGP